MTVRPWADLGALDRLWGSVGAPVLGADLRRWQPSRWVRFYTLPDGERIARTDEQRAEQRRRYLAVLDALGIPGLVTTVGRSEDLEAAAPAASWRTVPGEPELTVYASEVDRSDDLVPLLVLVADDRAHEVIVAAADLEWLMHPYDGGMDVITTADLGRFAVWRSPRADGL